jgi:hypothetical protein
MAPLLHTTERTQIAQCSKVIVGIPIQCASPLVKLKRIEIASLDTSAQYLDANVWLAPGGGSSSRVLTELVGFRPTKSGNR